MTTILFVDDEAMALESIRTVLRRERRRWRMVFASSGASALDHLDAERFDIVVSEARMPGLDGSEFLGVVRDRHPATVRIVLSGQIDEEVARRLTHVAHQCLAKPTPRDALRAALEGVVRLGGLLHDEGLRAMVGQVGHLPIAPTVYWRITRALDDPRSSVRQTAALVEADPGLCAKVLQLVNSAFFGLPRRITNVSDAVAFLGLDRLRYLVLSAEVMRNVADAAPHVDGLMANVQRRGLATADLCRAIAEEQGGVGPDDAFAAGVLHDIGIILLASRIPERYAPVLAASLAGEPLHELERRVLSVSHAEVGDYLLTLWGLPAPVAQAVGRHHAPGAADAAGLDLGAMLHVAQALVCEQIPGSPGFASGPALDPLVLEIPEVRERAPAWREWLARRLEGSAGHPSRPRRHDAAAPASRADAAVS